MYEYIYIYTYMYIHAYIYTYTYIYVTINRYAYIYVYISSYTSHCIRLSIKRTVLALIWVCDLLQLVLPRARQKMLRPWSQQARQLTPRRGTVARRESGSLCSHSHGESIAPSPTSPLWTRFTTCSC